MMGHQIHTARFDFSFANQQQALVMQQQLPDFLQQALLPKMDALFSELVPENVVFQLDKLEIDLGAIDFSTLKNNVLESVTLQVKEKIQQQINQQVEEQKKGQTTEDNPLFSTNEVGQKDPQFITQEALFFFLETGLLPWWASAKNPSILLNKILNNHPKKLCLYLEKKASNKIVERLLKQFSKKDFLRILKLKNPVKYEEFKILKNELKPLTINNLNEKHFSKIAFNYFFKNKQNIQDFRVTLLQTVKENTNTERAKKQANYFLKNVTKLLDTDRQEAWKKAFNIAMNISKKTTAILSSKSPNSSAIKIDTVLRQGTILHHAGIIILSPFLPRFFKNIGLVEKQDFISSMAQERAVLLTEYLATGTMTILENEAVLSKILCGLPLEYPLENTLILTKKEVTEIKSLLKSVIQNWTAIGKTSPAGLRQAFLQREGLLKKADTGYFLKMERLGRDVLLEKLPWGIGFVRLPWMEIPLEVEW